MNVSDKVTVIKNVNLIPMTTDAVIPNQTVIINGNTIGLIGRNQDIAIPAGAEIIDGTDKYLMPGLADMHAHYIEGYDRDSFFNLFLKNGVTAVRLYQGMPNEPGLIWRDEINKQKLFGPTLFTCGFLFNDPFIPVSSLETGNRNYDFVKIYSYLTDNEFNTVMRTAKKEGIYTIGHVPFLVGLDGVIKEGMNEVAHLTELNFDLVDYPKSEELKNQLMGIVYNNWVQDFYSSPSEKEYLAKIEPKIDEIVLKVKNAALFINTTLIVTQIISEQLYDKDNFLKRPELNYMLKSFMPEYLAGKNTYNLMIDALMNANKELVKGDNGSQFFNAYLAVNRTLAKKLHDAGVLLLLGTDTPAIVVAVVPGYSIHEELRLLTRCDLTPYQAIRTGTYNAGVAAEAMTGVNSIGTIETGKQADFILTSENPLDNVLNIQKMAGVMVQGRWLDKKELDSLEVEVKANLADLLSEVLQTNPGVESIEKLYQSLKSDNKANCIVLADPLNALGYDLLNSKRFEEAIVVFEILVKEFPDKWSWYDSLGEAYMKAGKKDPAIINFKKSLDLNPDSETGKAALKNLMR